MRPHDPAMQVQIADGYAWLADAERIAGNYPRALEYRIAQRQVLERLLARDARDAEVRGDLVANQLGIARLAAARGDWSNALAGLDAARDAAAVLTGSDPDDASMDSEGRVIPLFKAQTWLAMPRAQRPLHRDDGADSSDGYKKDGIFGVGARSGLTRIISGSALQKRE